MVLKSGKKMVEGYREDGPQLGVYFEEIENVTDTTKETLNNQQLHSS